MKLPPRSSPLLGLCLLLLSASFAHADNSKQMKLVGSLSPYLNGIDTGLYGRVVVDTDRGVAYLGSLDPDYNGPARGVAVIDIRDRKHPVLTTSLGPPPDCDGC